MREPMPIVTVAMPAYNAVPFVARAISSALDQRDIEVEVVVVDDGSTDGTADFIQGHFGHDTRVRVVRLRENRGPAAARNAAIDEARGQWLAVLDADDAFEPTHLRALVELAKAERAEIAAANFQFFDIHRSHLVGAGLRLRPETQRIDKYAFAAGARPGTGEADLGLLQPIMFLPFLRAHDLRYPENVRHGEDMEFIFMALVAGAKYIVRRDLCTYLYTTRHSGMSRTAVDYRSQVLRTLALSKHPGLTEDQHLCALLKDRAEALTRLDLDCNWNARSVGRVRLVRRALKSTAGRRWFFTKLVKKIGH